MAYTTINKPVSYFDDTLYSGNDGTQSITSLNFKPDFLWLKSRNTAVNHQLIDVIRGNTKQISSSDAAAEVTPTYPYTSTFDTNGWTMTNGSLSGGNTTGRTYVGWSWLGGGTGVSNTAGTISSTVSANTTAGFSIVSYTGTGANATVGHGLGSAPKMVMIKNRTSAENWRVGHSSLTSWAFRLILDATSAQTSEPNAFNSTAPTSTVFSVGTDDSTNKSTNSLIAYCFAEVKGYSKFGSYTGNASTNGPFVYTGFKPAFVICKSSSNAFAWVMHDSKRPGYNATNLYLYAQATNTEGSDIPHDFLSNGFKIRSTFSDTNGSGMTYIYMAFAENPFVSSTQIPTTAR
jgi:hypothetical protein